MTKRVRPSREDPPPLNLCLIGESAFLELDIVRVCDTDTCGTYVFDLKSLPRGNEFSNALLFARQQLMHEIEKKGYNVLVLERFVVIECPRLYPADRGTTAGDLRSSGGRTSIELKYVTMAGLRTHSGNCRLPAYLRSWGFLKRAARHGLP